ncbi:MAG: hypothetical protein OZ923_10915 [Comamonadaceae bacterium]|nr:hypothetical protein [Burkholderiales bacterium]MEB2349104.1 hypothetical protein [Comamonadaceae bacterium]
MASITERGPYQFQAPVRRKGWPSQTKTFERRTEARAWARAAEAQMDNRTFRNQRPLAGLTLHDALERYLSAVSCAKRSHAQERQRIRQLQRHPLALRRLSDLLVCDYAAYRDERLKQVSANTVRLEMALLSHLYTIAIKEWSATRIAEQLELQSIALAFPAIKHAQKQFLKALLIRCA